MEYKNKSIILLENKGAAFFILNMAQRDTIDITGVDKVALLRELWKRQKVAGFFATMAHVAPPFDDVDAAVAVTNGYIDYFRGRAIKTDLSKDVIKPGLYDRDAGPGTFQSVVDQLKK